MCTIVHAQCVSWGSLVFICSHIASDLTDTLLIVHATLFLSYLLLGRWMNTQRSLLQLLSIYHPLCITGGDLEWHSSMSVLSN